MKNTVTFNDGKDIIIEYFYTEVVFKSIVINLQFIIFTYCIFGTRIKYQACEYF